MYRSFSRGYPKLATTAAFAFACSSYLTFATGGSSQMINPTPRSSMSQPADPNHSFVGMWKTSDNYIRHELLSNGRYVEARGTRELAYQGRYEVRGTYIYYWDDTGFTADGDFIDDVLHHAGMILYREGKSD